MRLTHDIILCVCVCSSSGWRFFLFSVPASSFSWHSCFFVRCCFFFFLRGSCSFVGSSFAFSFEVSTIFIWVQWCICVLPICIVFLNDCCLNDGTLNEWDCCLWKNPIQTGNLAIRMVFFFNFFSWNQILRYIKIVSFKKWLKPNFKIY